MISKLTPTPKASNNILTWPIVLSGLIFIICLFFVNLIPPYQSSDEFDHLERGYLLSKGIIFMPLKNNPKWHVKQVTALEDQSIYRGNTGGVINLGLFQYMSHFDSMLIDASSKYDQKKQNSVKKIQWSKTDVYRTATGTSIYFPMIYLPQAIGFWLGEHIGLSVHNTYMLIRYILITSIFIILFCAFLIYPPNPLVLFLMTLPLSLYQFSSPTIDGTACALTVLFLSIVLKIIKKELTPRFLYYLLVIILITLSSARLQMLPLWLCAYYIAWKEKSITKVTWASIGLLFVAGWYVIILGQKSLHSYTGESTSSTIVFYFNNIDVFCDMIINTFAYGSIRLSWLQGLCAKIGWFYAATYFPDRFYQVTVFTGYIIALMSFSLKNFKDIYPLILSLLLVGLLSVFIIFLAMLFTFTPVSCEYIHGIQGRYFLLPLMCFSYAIGGGLGFLEGWRRKAGLIILSTYTLYSTVSLYQELLHRYYG